MADPITVELWLWPTLFLKKCGYGLPYYCRNVAMADPISVEMWL